VNNNLHTNSFHILRIYKFHISIDAKVRIGTNVCVLKIYLYRMSQKHFYIHVLFVIWGTNKHKRAYLHVIPFRYACIEYFWNSRHVFFPSWDIFETFCILYRSLFHFPLRLLLVSLKCISVGTTLRSCLPSIIVIEILTCLQDTEKSRFVSANREASALFLHCA